mmetsp:Transcript_65739/g.73594  ORF Transcript_65739/g.73594 Transcript_65739/m.73594 type:complete len:104 (+) Transcript_65739:52-363(+)
MVVAVAQLREEKRTVTTAQREDIPVRMNRDTPSTQRTEIQRYWHINKKKDNDKESCGDEVMCEEEEDDDNKDGQGHGRPYGSHRTTRYAILIATSSSRTVVTL